MKKAPKTRNSHTWSEGEFWSFIRASLRNRTRWWKPKLEALKRARRVSKSRNKRLKWEFRCNMCKKWFPQKEVEVNHITPVGSLRSSDDLAGFVSRLFCERQGLEVVCKICHKKHHSK